jgi:anthranilate phosphoribosyltransferase
LAKVSLSDLLGGTLEENAQITRSILGGEKGPKRDIVLLNAAAVIVAGGKADDIKEGMDVAAESIDSGAALKKIDELAKMSHSFG